MTMDEIVTATTYPVALRKSAIEQMEGYYDKQLLLNQEELIKLKHDMNNFLEIIRLKDEDTYQELKEKVQQKKLMIFSYSLAVNV